MNAPNNSIFLWYHRLCRYFMFPEANFCSKDFTLQTFSTVDSKSNSELAGWQSPQMQYICMHISQKTGPTTLQKSSTSSIWHCGSSFSSVMNYELSTRPWCCTGPSNICDPLENKKKERKSSSACMRKMRKMNKVLGFFPHQPSLSSLIIITCHLDPSYCMSSRSLLLATYFHASSRR